MSNSDHLHSRVRRFIDEALVGECSESFDEIACALAHFQVAHIDPVARYYTARNVDAANLRAADDIPAIACDAFRLRRIAAHPAASDERCFATSGTTGPARGRHPMRTTRTYQHAALRWAEQLLWPDGASLRFIALASPAERAPESSLSFMLSCFAEALSLPASWCWDGGALDMGSIRQAVEHARSAGEPALIAGTSFAFVHLCDSLSDSALALPLGSRVMQTGGFKGRSRQVAPEQLRSSIAACFGLPETHVVGEYGMTELSSQLYQGSLAATLMGKPAPPSASSYFAPPWMRVSAVDPVSLEPVPAGTRGICRIVDLANVDSAVAIQTADLVRVEPDGSIELLGRATGAEARGCSLAMEHLITGQAESS